MVCWRKNLGQIVAAVYWAPKSPASWTDGGAYAMRGIWVQWGWDLETVQTDIYIERCIFRPSPRYLHICRCWKKKTAPQVLTQNAQ